MDKRVFVSFTVSFSLDIIPRITITASSAVPLQQMTKSSALVDDLRGEPLLMPSRLPSFHKSSHVEI
jgi:hypothetical protein